MLVDEFFELLLKELDENPGLRNYYRFHKRDSRFEFRKAYFCQRLQYISDKVKNNSSSIWDCGCGYGTTGLYLALNGFKVYGTTIEYYYDQIPERFDFWKKYGDISGFSVEYKNLFEQPPSANQFDYVIVQDVLHHLEPLGEAIRIIKDSMKDSGQLIAIEENGKNVINNLKLYLRRGNKRIIDIYDEKTKKYVKLGNENIRGFNKWEQEFRHHQMRIDPGSPEFIRLFPPAFFNNTNYQSVLNREKKLWKQYALLRDYFYFGVNFTVSKNEGL
jgi:2-polyprenyl-3-methyl-5-hydroxy-6-metoxy-1,4-benzoquinol methylase